MLEVVFPPMFNAYATALACKEAGHRLGLLRIEGGFCTNGGLPEKG